MPDDFELPTVTENYQPRAMGVPGPSADSQPVAAEPDAQPRASENSGVTSLAKTLEALEQRVTSESQAARLLADPEIRALLQARERGVRVRMVPEDTQPQPVAAPPEEPEPDVEAMTNSQLVKYMVKTLTTTLGSSVSGRVDERINALKSELAPQLAGVVAATQQQQKARVQGEIESVKAKYSDFDQMRPKMVELNKSIQGLTVEELYLMSKVRSGLPMVTQKQIETERPVEAPGARREFKRPTNIRGRNGFAAVLDSALSGDLRSEQE